MKLEIGGTEITRKRRVKEIEILPTLAFDGGVAGLETGVEASRGNLFI